jgi:hypothetical protein
VILSAVGLVPTRNVGRSGWEVKSLDGSSDRSRGCTGSLALFRYCVSTNSMFMRAAMDMRKSAQPEPLLQPSELALRHLEGRNREGSL